MEQCLNHVEPLLIWGAPALKWLFGFAIQDDLESINRRIAGLTNEETAIFHILDKQATMINESLWEIRATTKMMAELQVQTMALNAITKKLLTQQETIIEYFEYFADLDSTFDSISAIILWPNQLANALDVGMDVLANAPQIFSPPPTVNSSYGNQRTTTTWVSSF